MAKLWFVALAVTGIIMANQLVTTIYHMQIGIGLFNVSAIIICGGLFAVIILKMHRRGMLRWWHVLPVMCVGAALFPDQMIIGPLIGYSVDDPVFLTADH